MVIINKAFKTTAEFKISKKVIDQVIGQEDAVKVIKKAAQQRRHVLLIGEPGTGKSMLGLALAELLPKEKLVDILSFPNPNDENQPLIRVMPAGKGRSLVMRAKLEGSNMFKNQNIIMFILVIIAMIAPWWIRHEYMKDGAAAASIMFAAMFLGGMVFLAAFILFINLGKKMGGMKTVSPKVIVDNFKKKQASFFDATGAHAGALLGDVLHDPFQCHFPDNCLYHSDNNQIKVRSFKGLIGPILNKEIGVEKRAERNYEAVHLPKDKLFVLGETNGSVSSVEVLSSNRHDHNGEMIKLTTSENKELIVTQEHKIAIWRIGKIEYIEARNIQEGDEVVSRAEDIIIDEQDIINTYDERQQEQCRLYYQYKKLKAENPTWGYKRISKRMGQSEAKTRWWHVGKYIPYPVQTIEWLKEKGLIPLDIDNPNLLLIAKVLGATFGDGGIFENLNGIFLSSSEKEAVQEFGNDLEKIFGLKKNKNSRIIEGGEYGHSWCYQNTNRNIIRFFLALGTPRGKKTEQELIIPKWISIKENIEDEFHGSLFGSELGTPSLHKDKNRLTTLELGITGNPNHHKNRQDFLLTIASYLERRRILCNSIYIRRLDENSVVYRLQIAKKIDNVLLFLMNTKINYCKYKQDRLYKALGQWAMLKKKKYYELLNRGYGAEHAMRTLNLTPNSLYLLFNHFGPKGEVEA